MLNSPTLIHIQHGLSLRAGQTFDQDFLDILYASTRDDLRQLETDTNVINTLIKMQQRVHEHGQHVTYPNAESLILEHQSTPIGRIVLDTTSSGMRIIDISLLPEAQNKGYASATLRYLQHYAASRDIPIMLAVGATNLKAKHLYLAVGFQTESSDGLFEQMRWQPSGKTGTTAETAVPAASNNQNSNQDRGLAF